VTLPKILVITPVRHITGVPEVLEATGPVTYMDDPTPEEVIAAIGKYDALYTNPNKSKVFIGPVVIDAASNLKVICTASTGTNHIDKSYAAEKGLPILALTEEREVISRISSTAELAFALTMAGLRHVVRSHNAVLRGEWDYTRYIGRQMNYLTIGVIGYGRLGAMYARYCQAFGSRVLVYDPYKTVDREGLEQVKDLSLLLHDSDVIAIHVHVSDETQGMMNAACFAQMKKDVLLVNTSRGDIVNEPDIVAFLRASPQARVATDVLADEIRNRLASPLLQYAHESEQVIITPHIGGMSREAQEIAYGHAAHSMQSFFATRI
jgi:phosphoglycerate dehydrogenase-like enzyme